MKSVTVNFINNHTAYEYLYDLNTPVSTGDYVVVDSPYNGIVTAKVVGVHSVVNKATKYVVDIVDLSAHIAREATRLKAEELTAKLDKRMKALDKLMRYELAASLDPEIASLLKELKKVQV